MNIPPLLTTAPTPAPAAAPVMLTLLEGDVGRLLTGQLLQAVARPVAAGQVRLDVAGLGNLLVSTSAEVPAGQALTVRVRGLQPQVRLEVVSPQDLATANSPQGRAAAGPVAPATPELVAALASPLTPPSAQLSLPVGGEGLRPGDRLLVQVLGEAGPQRLAVVVNGTPLEAVTAEPYPAGSMLDVEVVRTQPEVILRALPPVTADVQLSSELLRQRLPVSPVAETLAPLLAESSAGESPPAFRALLSRLAALLPENAPPDARALAEFVRDGGLQYEARLASIARADGRGEQAIEVAHRDVKGLLLGALAETAERGDIAGLRTALLERHLGSIEAQQAANLLAAARGDPLLVQVPLFFPDRQATTLHLALRQDGGGGGTPSNQGGHTLLMHVDLPDLGAVRIDAHLLSGVPPGGLRVTFYAEQAAGKERLLAELPSLGAALQQLGQGPVHLAVRDWRQMPDEQQLTFQGMLQGLPRSGSSLDIRA